MRLHPQAVEYYKLGMTTEPTTTPTDWAASFDGGGAGGSGGAAGGGGEGAATPSWRLAQARTPLTR